MLVPSTDSSIFLDIAFPLVERLILVCELDRADTHAIVSNFPCVFNTEMERLKKVIKKRGAGLREEKRKRKIVETG